MTKKELIDHLQHLEKYTHYSEDAPALREAIEMLECSEMPNGSEERTQERTRTHACDLIDRREAIEALFDWEMTYDWDDHCREEDPKPAYIVSPSDVIEHLPPAQPDMDEWCTDCKEYDQERHCCLRFNRVIRETLKEAQPEIIYCKDCKYLDIQGTYGECGKGILGIVNRDDFCSRAERRTDDLQ